MSTFEYSVSLPTKLAIARMVTTCKGCVTAMMAKRSMMSLMTASIAFCCFSSSVSSSSDLSSSENQS